MQFTYELTQRDFYEGLLAHRNRTALSKWTWRVVFAVIVLLFCITVLGAALSPSTRTASSLAPLWIVLFLWAVVLLGLPHLQARRQFVKQPAAHGSRTLQAETAGIHWNWNGGSSFIEWRMLVRWFESKNHFLLYWSPVLFHMVPKRALTPDQVSEFRSLLQQNIIPKN